MSASVKDVAARAGVSVGTEATVQDAATLRIAGDDVRLPAAAASAVWLTA